MLNRIVTSSESWVRHVLLWSKCTSVHWKRPGSPITKKFKVELLLGMVMFTVFGTRNVYCLSLFKAWWNHQYLITLRSSGDTCVYLIPQYGGKNSISNGSGHCATVGNLKCHFRILRLHCLSSDWKSCWFQGAVYKIEDSKCKWNCLETHTDTQTHTVWVNEWMNSLTALNVASGHMQNK
jgi:hypothetical protein